MGRYLSLFAAVSLLIACQPGDFPGGGYDSSGRIGTGEVSAITETSAVLSGYVNMPDGSGARFGIVYSTDKTPTLENGKTLRSWDLDDNNQFSCQATGLLIAETYYYRAFLVENARYRWGKTISFTTKDFTGNGQEAVDLGLSVKWRAGNLGTSDPFSAGDYYAWGETAPKTDYFQNNYVWSRGDEFTKYNHEDGKLELDPADDAARVRLGGSWRMPTYAEFRELLSCPRTWTGRKGVMGILFTGPSGAKIFLPAVGDRVGTNTDAEGNRGCYWSSTLPSPNSYYAWLAYMHSGVVTMTSSTGFGRYHGQSIRPVSD